MQLLTTFLLVQKIGDPKQKNASPVPKSGPTRTDQDGAGTDADHQTLTSDDGVKILIQGHALER